jgi:putative transposase
MRLPNASMAFLKKDFRLNRVFTTFDKAAHAVEQSVRNYNHLRPHMSYSYLTPAADHASTEPMQKCWKPNVYKAAQPPASADTA